MDLRSAVELIHVQLNLIHNAPEEVIPLLRRAKDFLDRLKFWIETPGAQFVYWVERRGRGTYLQATPIDVVPSSNRVFSIGSVPLC